MTTIRVTCLASGSSGNSLLIQSGDRALLVDCGIGPRRLLPILHERGVGAGALDGVLITHEHSDHTAGAQAVSARTGAPVVCNHATYAAVRWQGERPPHAGHPTGSTRTVGRFDVTSFSVSHDAAAPVGYVVEAAGRRVAVFTDLGCGSEEVAEAMRAADLVLIEANHDVGRLTAGPYPWHLKRRILADTGHLSNLQTASLIAQGVGVRRQTFWLAHLSRINNTRRTARESVTAHLLSLGLDAEIRVADRDRPSLVWEPDDQPHQIPLLAAAAG